VGKKWQQENRAAYNAAWLRWYHNNKARKMAWQSSRREAMRLWFVEFKSTKACEVCAESAPECLHFHHVDPSTKEIDISNVVSNATWSKARILAEIAKCRVLCANCHLKHHWDEEK
jgi:hypothetical protein